MFLGSMLSITSPPPPDFFCTHQHVIVYYACQPSHIRSLLNKMVAPTVLGGLLLLVTLPPRVVSPVQGVYQYEWFPPSWLFLINLRNSHFIRGDKCVGQLHRWWGQVRPVFRCVAHLLMGWRLPGQVGWHVGRFLLIWQHLLLLSVRHASPSHRRVESSL